MEWKEDFKDVLNAEFVYPSFTESAKNLSSHRVQPRRDFVTDLVTVVTLSLVSTNSIVLHNSFHFLGVSMVKKPDICYCNLHQCCVQLYSKDIPLLDLFRKPEKGPVNITS